MNMIWPYTNSWRQWKKKVACTNTRVKIFMLNKPTIIYMYIIAGWQNHCPRILSDVIASKHYLNNFIECMVSEKKKNGWFTSTQLSTMMMKYESKKPISHKQTNWGRDFATMLYFSIVNTLGLHNIALSTTKNLCTTQVKLSFFHSTSRLCYFLSIGNEIFSVFLFLSLSFDQDLSFLK